MTETDLAELKARIEQAVAEAAAELAQPPERTASSPSQCDFPIEHAWALVNVECCRQAFVDRALKRLGGKSFTVAVDSKAIAISSSDAKATVTPSKPQSSTAAALAPTPTTAEPSHDASAPNVT